MGNLKETALKLFNLGPEIPFTLYSQISRSILPAIEIYLLFFFLEIGDIAGVADVTIRQSYRLIFLRAAELFPSDFKFTTPVDKLPNL